MQEQVEALNQEIDNIDLEIDQEDMIYPEPLAPQVIGDILIDREEDEMVLVNNAADRVESDSSYGEEDDSSSNSDWSLFVFLLVSQLNASRDSDS